MNEPIKTKLKLEEEWLKKQLRIGINSIAKAKYKINGQEKEIDIYKKVMAEDEARIYLYFDDSIEGEISDIILVDGDGEFATKPTKSFIKSKAKGHLIRYRCRLEEVIVEDMSKDEQEAV